MKTKFRKFTASLVMIAMLISQMSILSVFADTTYAEGTIIIALDTDGKPTSASGDGWTYESDIITLNKGYSFAVDGTCNVNITNYGTIVGGIYNNTVNNTGNTQSTADIGGVINDGIFNGDVNNYHGWNTCTVNGGTFNGKFTIGNHGIIKGGTFLGDFDKKLGYKINSATFKIEFITDGGTWAEGYTAPTTYDYSTSAGITLPTAENISKDNDVFGGWYTASDFSGNSVANIPAKSTGKLTYYAQFTDVNATWELVGEQAKEDTDYKVDDSGNYSIITAKGLAKIANIVNDGDTLNGKTVTLANDINLLEGGVTDYNIDNVKDLNSWIPIDGFAGTFDGNGKKISNLYISITDKYAGLFGSMNGTVKDLEISSGKIKVSTSAASLRVGGICAVNSGTIDNCVNKADISVAVSYSANSNYNAYVGGIAGMLSTSDSAEAVRTILNSTNDGKILLEAVFL